MLIEQCDNIENAEVSNTWPQGRRPQAGLLRRGQHLNMMQQALWECSDTTAYDAYLSGPRSAVKPCPTSGAMQMQHGEETGASPSRASGSSLKVQLFLQEVKALHNDQPHIREDINTADVAATCVCDAKKITFMAPSHDRKVHFAKRDSSSFCSISLHACPGKVLREPSAVPAEPPWSNSQRLDQSLTIVPISCSKWIWTNKLQKFACEASTCRYTMQPRNASQSCSARGSVETLVQNAASSWSSQAND